MNIKIKIIFHSLYGHIYQLAEAIAEGARSVSGVEAELLQVPETLPDSVLEKMGALESKKTFAHIPYADVHTINEADALIFGSGTRFGSASAQLQAFFDATGSQWAKGTLIGKPGGVFSSSATQHGGQESTLLSMHTFLLHHGMVIVGVPFSVSELSNTGEITGGTPYGSSTIAGTKGERTPTENELNIARFQGKRTAEIAIKLATNSGSPSK